MGGNSLGLVELSLVLFSALGWAIYELHALREKPPIKPDDDKSDAPISDGHGRRTQDEAASSTATPRHPERQ